MSTANALSAANSETNTIMYSTIACPQRRDRIGLCIHPRISIINGPTM